MAARFRLSADKRDPTWDKGLHVKNSFLRGDFLAPSFSKKCSPVVTVVAMARNEASRIHDSMRHFCALFDRVVFIDHGSEDETANIAMGYHGINGTEVIVLRADDPGYFQSKYMSAVANALIAEQASEWIFFLDLDEYLPFLTAVDFRQALIELSEFSVIYSHWYNLSLTSLDSDSLQDAEALVGPRVSDFVKIAINCRRIPAGEVTICQGNHAVMLPGLSGPFIGQRAFGLFHVPFVSYDALKRKVAQGTEALNAAVGLSKNLGFHWREIHNNRHLLANDLTLLTELSLNYARPIGDILTAIASKKLTTGTRPIRLRFAQTNAACGPSVKTSIDSFTLETVSEVLRTHFMPRPIESDVLSPPVSPRFSGLSQRASQAPELGTGRDRIEHALLAAVANVEVLVSSAWVNHIPFLFALMETTRPRRFVELGTHAGASFFAACQHIRSNGNYGEAVAIDTWAGDHQAGFYNEAVFEKFEFSLNQFYSKTGKYIRKYFIEAVSCFDDKSIDMLHIDGLHTYEAVKLDYETWLPKLSDNGVIIFHDTNEYQCDFGVWQFFNEIRTDATASFQFRHGHGLGVMAFGKAGLNPAIEMIEHFNSRPEKIESYFSVLGKALHDAAQWQIREN